MRDPSGQTQSVLQHATDVTQRELTRLQVGQDLAATQNHRHAVQSALRSLAREPQSRVRENQIGEWKAQEAQLNARTQTRQHTRNPSLTP